MRVEPTLAEFLPGDLPQTAAGLVALIAAATRQLSQVSLLAESDAGTLEVIDDWEEARRIGDHVSARLLIEASDRDLARSAGYATVHQFLAHGLRLGKAESARRRTVARETGRLRNLQGEVLPPRLPECARALAEGAIGAPHVDVIADIVAKIPAAVAQPERDRAERVLVDAARTVSPDDLPFLGSRILAYLDPDGSLTDEADRKRRRGFLLCRQDRQLMSKLRARVTPELRAKLEVILTVWAAPGMNNPSDEGSPFGAVDQPGLDPAEVTAAAERDDRTQFQRNHDALVALCDFVLGHGALGKPDRVPSELVITVTESELASRTGTAVTATGTRVPVADLVALAAQANPWLEVFADHTPAILSFGRGGAAWRPKPNGSRCSGETAAAPCRAAAAPSPKPKRTTCRRGATAVSPTSTDSVRRAGRTTVVKALHPASGSRQSSLGVRRRAESPAGRPEAAVSGGSTRFTTPNFFSVTRSPRRMHRPARSCRTRSLRRR